MKNKWGSQEESLSSKKEEISHPWMNYFFKNKAQPPMPMTPSKRPNCKSKTFKWKIMKEITNILSAVSNPEPQNQENLQDLLFLLKMSKDQKQRLTFFNRFKRNKQNTTKCSNMMNKISRQQLKYNNKDWTETLQSKKTSLNRKEKINLDCLKPTKNK